MPRRSGGPKFYISLQRYYYSGLLMVEIAMGGPDHASPGETGASRLCQRLGAGRTFSDPREAVVAALQVRQQWRKDLSSRNRKRSSQIGRRLRVYVSLGSTEGGSKELEPMSFHDLHAKADEIYERLPKCDNCSELLGDETYVSMRSDAIGVKFCSEGCAEADNLFCLKSEVIDRVMEQVRDDPRTQADGVWSCKLYEDGHVVTFRPNVGEKLTWEVHPDTHEIKTEEEINPPGIGDEESDDE